MTKGKSEERPGTLGDLRHGRWSEERIGARSVRDEMRENLLAKSLSGNNVDTQHVS